MVPVEGGGQTNVRNAYYRWDDQQVSEQTLVWRSAAMLTLPTTSLTLWLMGVHSNGGDE